MRGGKKMTGGSMGSTSNVIRLSPGCRSREEPIRVTDAIGRAALRLRPRPVHPVGGVEGRSAEPEDHARRRWVREPFHLEAQGHLRVGPNEPDLIDLHVVGEPDHPPGMWVVEEEQRKTHTREENEQHRLNMKIGTEMTHVDARNPRPTTRRLRRMRGTSTGSPVRSRAPWR